MNRTFKFRIWDKEYKTWRELPDLYGDYQANAHRTYGEGFSIHNFFNTNDGLKFKEGVIVVQQYTALKDKNGKEIVEGDILRLLDDKCNNPVGEVYFGSGAFHVRGVDCLWYGAKHGECEDYEIIGNIFENPELIKNEN